MDERELIFLVNLCTFIVFSLSLSVPRAYESAARGELDSRAD